MKVTLKSFSFHFISFHFISLIFQILSLKIAISDELKSSEIYFGVTWLVAAKVGVLRGWATHRPRRNLTARWRSRAFREGSALKRKKKKIRRRHFSKSFKVFQI